jgi:dienelactone hydrolase
MTTRAFRAGPAAFVVALAAALAACSNAPDDVAPASESELGSPGPFDVGEADVVLVDRSRPTRPNGTFAGAPERTLATRIWFPSAPGGDGARPTLPEGAGPFPLIGYGHGYLSSRGEAPELKRHLASHGYVVVAPDFPLSNGGAVGGPTIADMASQPGDLAFVLAEAEHLPGPLAAISAGVDPSRRGIAGLSLGGGTTLIAAYHPTLHVEGIAAAVAFAPASCFFGPALYAHAVPTLILAGDADEIVPLDSGPARGFASAPPPVALARLIGGNHLGFIGAEIPGVPNTDRAIGCGAVENAGTGGIEELFVDLTAGAGPDAVDATSCGTGICAQSFVQTMHADRQVELTKIATLAHFEAILRGRADAARYLAEVFAADNPDVELSVKD